MMCTFCPFFIHRVSFFSVYVVRAQCLKKEKINCRNFSTKCVSNSTEVRYIFSGIYRNYIAKNIIVNVSERCSVVTNANYYVV
jgi:hypothetical protein